MCSIEAIGVTYQIPAGWVTGGTELVVGAEDDEDFWSHFRWVFGIWSIDERVGMS